MSTELEQDLGLAKRTDLHLTRKIWHVSTVSLMVLTYIYLPERVAHGLLLLFMVIFIPMDFYRQFNPWFNRRLIRAMRFFIRQSEVRQLAGTTYLMCGVAVLAILFPRRVNELSLMFLALADPIASYFGIRFGKDTLWGQKSVQGFLAAFVTCFLISLFYFHWTNMMMERWVLASLIAGFIGASSELIQIGKLDDNFTLPVLSASMLSLLYYLFGVF